MVKQDHQRCDCSSRIFVVQLIVLTNLLPPVVQCPYPCDKEAVMLTIDQVVTYLERVIAEDTLSANLVGLRNAQRAAGFLMSAAEAHADKELARRLRILAAQAANKAEELEKR
jgi:hypothetical protein